MLESLYLLFDVPQCRCFNQHGSKLYPRSPRNLGIALLGLSENEQVYIVPRNRENDLAIFNKEGTRITSWFVTLSNYLVQVSTQNAAWHTNEFTYLGGTLPVPHTSRIATALPATHATQTIWASAPLAPQRSAQRSLRR